MNFTVKLDVYDKSIRIPQLTNKQYIDIVKYCENKDIEGFCNYFDNWLEIFKDLNCIEKFYVLVAMRIIFIDPFIHCKGNMDQVLQYDLNNILLVMDDIENSYREQENNIIIDIPRSLNPQDIITSTIVSGDIHMLPIKTIHDFLTRVDNRYKNVMFLAGYEEFIKTPIRLSIKDGILPVFLMELYGQPLMNLYQTQYHFLNKVSKSYEHYISLTPGETNLILKMYSSEIENKNKELNKQQ